MYEVVDKIIEESYSQARQTQIIMWTICIMD